MSDLFNTRFNEVSEEFEKLVTQKNSPEDHAGNGIFTRYKNPVVTAAHTPLEWRFDMDAERIQWKRNNHRLCNFQKKNQKKKKKSFSLQRLILR